MCRRACAMDLPSIPFCFVLFHSCPSTLSCGPALSGRERPLTPCALRLSSRPVSFLLLLNGVRQPLRCPTAQRRIASVAGGHDHSVLGR